MCCVIYLFTRYTVSTTNCVSSEARQVVQGRNGVGQGKKVEHARVQRARPSCALAGSRVHLDVHGYRMAVHTGKEKRVDNENSET